MKERRGELRTRFRRLDERIQVDILIVRLATQPLPIPKLSLQGHVIYGYHGVRVVTLHHGKFGCAFLGIE